MGTTLAIGAFRQRVGNPRAGARLGRRRPMFGKLVAPPSAAANDPIIEMDRSQPFPAIAWARTRAVGYVWIDASVTVAVVLFFAAALVTMAGEI